jgi:Ca2+-binding EF-hand superfamily protein
MSIIRGVAIVLAATVLGGDAGQAREPGRFADRMFDRIDADHDGVLTRSEVQAARSRMFDRLDADRDGALTAAEAEAARNQARARAARRSERFAGTQGERLATLDRNRDAVVSRDEFVAGTSWFDRMDSTGRGVTKAQFVALINQAR